jgi:hypothetical protein
MAFTRALASIRRRQDTEQQRNWIDVGATVIIQQSCVLERNAMISHWRVLVAGEVRHCSESCMLSLLVAAPREVVHWHGRSSEGHKKNAAWVHHTGDRAPDERRRRSREFPHLSSISETRRFQLPDQSEASVPGRTFDYWRHVAHNLNELGFGS